METKVDEVSASCEEGTNTWKKKLDLARRTVAVLVARGKKTPTRAEVSNGLWEGCQDFTGSSEGQEGQIQGKHATLEAGHQGHPCWW